MDILQIAVFGLCCALLSAFLKEVAPPYAILASAAACIVLFLALIGRFADMLSWLSALNTVIGSDSFSILLKAMGIALVTQLAQDCCKDAGSSALANAVDFSGRLMIFAAALPLIQDVLSLIQSLLQ